MLLLRRTYSILTCESYNFKHFQELNGNHNGLVMNICMVKLV